MAEELCLGNLHVTGADGGDDVLGGSAVDGAADGAAGAEHLEHAALEGLGEGLGVHDAGDADDLVERNAVRVHDVLCPFSDDPLCAAGRRQTLVFLRSRAGSLRALMMSDDAEGTTSTCTKAMSGRAQGQRQVNERKPDGSGW